MTGVLSAIDDLYRGCVTEPDRWNAQAFQDWAEGVASGATMDRMTARFVRRSLRAGQKLATFWAAHTGHRPEDWRARVDMALGARAWRPQLELAEYLLERDRTEDAFHAVTALFPVVHNQPFLDGVSFEEWQEVQDQPGSGGSIDA